MDANTVETIHDMNHTLSCVLLELSKIHQQNNEILKRIEILEKATPESREVRQREEQKELKKKIEEKFECPNCKSRMRIRNSAFGLFAGCTRYPDCNGSRDIHGNNTTKREYRLNRTAPPGAFVDSDHAHRAEEDFRERDDY